MTHTILMVDSAQSRTLCICRKGKRLLVNANSIKTMFHSWMSVSIGPADCLRVYAPNAVRTLVGVISATKFMTLYQ